MTPSAIASLEIVREHWFEEGQRVVLRLGGFPEAVEVDAVVAEVKAYHLYPFLGFVRLRGWEHFTFDALTGMLAYQRVSYFSIRRTKLLPEGTYVVPPEKSE